MKRFCLVYLLFSLSSTLFAQVDTTAVADSNFIPVIAYWNLNDTFEYQITKTKVKYNEDRTVRDSSGSIFNQLLVVVDSTDTNYVIRVFQDLDLNDFKGNVSKFKLNPKTLKGLTKILNSQNLEYVVSQEGEFLEVRNLDRIVKAMRLLLDQYDFKDEDMSKDQIAVVKKLFDRVTNPTVLQNHFMQYFVAMHKFYGLQYAQDSVWAFEEEIVNPLDTSKILIYQNEMIATVPEDWGGLIRIQNYVTIDEENSMALIKALYAETEVFDQLDEIYKEHPPRFEHYISYAIDPDTGVIFAMYYEKSSFLGGKLLEQETYNMELK